MCRRKENLLSGEVLTGFGQSLRIGGPVQLTPTRLFHGGNPFRKNSSKGGSAMEVVGRASTTDLDDGRVQGGELRNFSVGMNWYLSRVHRVSLNYVHSKLVDSGKANIVLLRYPFDP